MVQTKKCTFCFTYVPTIFWLLLWTMTVQTHSNVESFLSYMLTKKRMVMLSMPLSSNRPQEPLKMCVGFSLLYNFDSCFCPLLATLVISIESVLDFWNLCNYQETHMMDLLHSSPLALYAWSPDATTFCKKWAMAPVAMTLWTNGRPSKYLKSMANGLRGAGYIHSFTISAIMSQSLLSD